MDGEIKTDDENVAERASVSDTSRQQSRDPLVGTNLGGRFHIEEVLGAGGMSVVYKAKQLAVNRHVAIKTIRMQLDSKPVYRERFDREISSLCSLSHPNIVTVYDCIIGTDGQPYVVMDYLRGRSLETLIKSEGPLSLERFARITLQVCSAMDHAHKRGIIHRDLKPSNIVLMDDEMDFVKVVDFGLARLSEDNRKITQSGELWGSPPYMSPEQCMGESGDERSDIYAMGCVMYEMLTGRDPFWYATTIFELIQRHVNTVPASFAEANPNAVVPYAVESVIFQALEKNPMSRFKSAQELQEALVTACASSDRDSGELYLHPAMSTRSGGTPSGESSILSGFGENSGRSEKSQQMAWFGGMLQAGNAGLESTSESSGQMHPPAERVDDMKTAGPVSKWARPTGGDVSNANHIGNHQGDSGMVSRQSGSGFQGARSHSNPPGPTVEHSMDEENNKTAENSGGFGERNERADVGRLRQSSSLADVSRFWLPALVIIGVLIGVGCAIICATTMPEMFGGPKQSTTADRGGTGSAPPSAPSDVGLSLPSPRSAVGPDDNAPPAVEATDQTQKQPVAVPTRKISKASKVKRTSATTAVSKIRSKATVSSKPAPAKKSDPWAQLRNMGGH